MPLNLIFTTTIFFTNVQCGIQTYWQPQGIKTWLEYIYHFKPLIEKNDEFWFAYFSCTHEEKNHIINHFSKKYMRIPTLDKTMNNE